MSVLIIADREGDRPVAVPRGLALAKTMGWDADVVGFCYEPLAGLDPAEGHTAKQQLMAQRRETLNTEIEEHAPAGVNVSSTVVWEKSVRTWVDLHLLRANCEAVVKTAHRTETLLYTPTDWHLLRECEAPVLIVADRIWHPMRSVVAAVDLASHSRVKQDLNDDVIRTAKRYAEALGCPLHLLYVIRVSKVLNDLEVIDVRARAKKIRRQIQPVIADLANRHQIPADSVRIESGETEKVIPSAAARLQAQLVVMGTVGRHGVNARLIGNTAERVLMRLRTDVLAIKPGLADGA